MTSDTEEDNDYEEHGIQKEGRRRFRRGSDNSKRKQRMFVFNDILSNMKTWREIDQENYSHKEILERALGFCNPIAAKRKSHKHTKCC